MIFLIEWSNLPNEKDKHSNGRQVAGSEWVKQISKRLDNLCDVRFDPWTPKTAKSSSQTSQENMFKPLMYRQRGVDSRSMYVLVRSSQFILNWLEHTWEWLMISQTPKSETKWKLVDDGKTNIKIHACTIAMAIDPCYGRNNNKFGITTVGQTTVWQKT